MRLIDKITELFIDNSDSDGTWDACCITEEVMSFLTEEGSDRLLQCGHCSTWWPTHIYVACPYYEGHPCEGGCGETNENCTCENCDDCGYYECECPTCGHCGEKKDGCNCPEEEAVFQ